MRSELEALAREAAREVLREAAGGHQLPVSPRYLSPTQLSQLIGVTPQYLTKLRRLGKGPKWWKLGIAPQSPIRYDLKDVEEWVRDHNGGGGEVG